MPSYHNDPYAPVPNNPRTVGAVALIVRDGALLLERRIDDGTWALIGGALEDDETVTDAVKREVREETGLAATAVALFGVFSDPTRIVEYLDGNVFRLFTVVFRVEVEDGEPVASEESEEVRFVPIAELSVLELFPVHRSIIDSFLSQPSTVVVA